MINPSWLVQTVGLRAITKKPNGVQSDLEMVSLIAEGGLRSIRDKSPFHRMVSNSTIRKWLRSQNAVNLLSPNRSGISQSTAIYGKGFTYPNINIDEWLNFICHYPSKVPLNYREDGSALVSAYLRDKKIEHVISFQGLRSLLSIRTNGTYSPSLIERWVYPDSVMSALNTKERSSESPIMDAPLGGRTSFRMPTFWTDVALRNCQEEALRSTAIWTSAVKDLPPMASAISWETENPRLGTIREVFKDLGVDVTFAIEDATFVEAIAGTPDYSRMGIDELRNTYLKIPTGLFGRRLDGRNGYAERASEERRFVLTDWKRIQIELSQGKLVEEGVINESLLESVFQSERNIEHQSYFLFRNLELELWLRQMK